MKVSEEQVLGFRERRLGLLGSASSLVEAARMQVGAQSQVESCACLGVALRSTSGTAAEAKALTGGPWVRTWGPRDTVHLFPIDTWPLVVAARSEWTKSARRFSQVPPGLLEDAAQHLQMFDRTVTRSDFRELLPASWLEEAASNPYFDTPDKQWRFCTGRLIWELSNHGLLCHAEKKGSEQMYAPRSLWFPDLPAFDGTPVEAAVELMRLYLRSYGPASIQDVAHFFGTNVSIARTWLQSVSGWTTVECEGRSLWSDDRDRDDLVEPVSDTVVMLPGYDNLLMGHADKSWTTPEEVDRKKVWAKAAVVKPVVLHRGRIVATWSHKVRAKYVTVTVTPLSRWTDVDVQPAAERVAHALGRNEVQLTVEAGA